MILSTRLAQTLQMLSRTSLPCLPPPCTVTAANSVQGLLQGKKEFPSHYRKLAWAKKKEPPPHTHTCAGCAHVVGLQERWQDNQSLICSSWNRGRDAFRSAAQGWIAGLMTLPNKPRQWMGKEAVLWLTPKCIPIDFALVVSCPTVDTIMRPPLALKLTVLYLCGVLPLPVKSCVTPLIWIVKIFIGGTHDCG